MVLDGTTVILGELNSMDRISELPDSILHHIISLLGSEESCRTRILSKRWVNVWSTGLILDFSIQFFKETIDSLVDYIETLKLVSLQSLDLTEVDIDEHMLQRIILSCPLKNLRLWRCSGVENISILRCSKLESLDVFETVPTSGSIEVDTASVHCFFYQGLNEDDPWTFTLTPISKKYLKVLSIYAVLILDNIVDTLVSELSSIETMSFYGCVMPKNMRIASLTLEELGIYDCYDLVNIVIDAPQLEAFCYTGDLQLSSVTSSHSKRNAYIHLKLDNVVTGSFRKIKRLLSRSKCCNVFSIILSDAPEIEFDKHKIYDGPPFDVEEVRLSLSCSIPEKSSLIALIDGLFWSCRPAMLSISISLAIENTILKSLMEILEEKVKCWKHPLKRFEIEGTNWCGLMFSWNLGFQLRLYW